jgi:hypothetical protein
MADLHISFRTANSLSNIRFAERFYDIFNRWNWPPERFDKYEPIRLPWSRRNDFIEAWVEQGQTYFGQVLVQRKRSFPYYANPIMPFGPKATCHFVNVYGIAELKCTDDALFHIVRLADELFAELELDYGRICLSDDFDAKNIVKNYRDPQGRLEPRHVIGVKEWPACLPGIYWINYFGRKYLEQGLNTSFYDKDIELTHLGESGIRLQLAERPDYFRLNGSDALENRTMDRLGREWFFENQSFKVCKPLRVSRGQFQTPPAAAKRFPS